jgi:hypothetical protein
MMLGEVRRGRRSPGGTMVAESQDRANCAVLVISNYPSKKYEILAKPAGRLLDFQQPQLQ